MQQQNKDYGQLLAEFIAYREESLGEKEGMRREVEKCRQQLQKLNSKLDKRVEARLKEENIVANHRTEELEQLHAGQVLQLNALLAQKDRTAEEMRHLLRVVERQKRELIQNNTRVLVELSQGLDYKGQKPSEAMAQNYKELMKMYQFLIEDNNQLQKEVYTLRNHHATAPSLPPNYSTLQQDHNSAIHLSEHKPKSLADSSKRQVLVTNKSQQSRDRPKERPKKPLPQKPPKK